MSVYQGRTKTLFIRYAIQQMIGLLFNSVYIIVDGIFIGNRLGTDAMAATAVSGLLPFSLLYRILYHFVELNQHFLKSTK